VGRSEAAGSDAAGTVRRNRELQRRFYGEPLGDRLRRLLAALDVSQAALAAALGVSSPMLSQLMSGRRVKIGTPAVFGRLVLLEQAVTQHADPAADPVAVERLLADVRATEPRAPTSAPGSYDLLRTVAGPDELARAADTLDRGFPSLAGLLRRAASAEAPEPGR
jgi:transcriptional regulator with XRE-family HTH domain